MLPTIVPLYAEYVLNVPISIMTSVMFGLTFISAMLFMTLVWKPVVRKLGNRKSWMMSMTVWIVTLIPLIFIQEIVGGMIVFFLIGIGLSGSLYIIDLIIADVIDDDELRTGNRKEGGYYGVNAFFLRFSNVLVIIAVGIIFGYNGWQEFTPTPGIQTINGLKILMCVLPIIALVIAILAIYKYPLDGEKLVMVKEGVKKLHEEKQSKI
jgi:GPH family glycoside/pentoside/hexuronide:cation symporter